MSPDERRSRIVQMVDSGARVRLTELAAMFGVSAVTVHRDLDLLARAGMVERVRGGAVAVGGGHRPVLTDWGQRLLDAPDQKAAIARHALHYVEEGSTIFLDASTTCLELAREIEKAKLSSLTIVTNSPAIAHQIKSEGVHLIVCPGEVDQTLGMIGGPWANDFLESLSFSSAFVSVGGMTAAAVSTTRPAIADILKVVARRSAHSFCLVQASKIGVGALTDVMWPGEFEAVIVDGGIPDRQLALLRESGINVEVAEGFDSDSSGNR